MPGYDASSAQCPFYIENFSKKQASENRIRCEGVESNNKINLIFETKVAKQNYMVKYCFGIESCEKCRIHRMLDEKYEVDDE